MSAYSASGVTVSVTVSPYIASVLSAVTVPPESAVSTVIRLMMGRTVAATVTSPAGIVNCDPSIASPLTVMLSRS